MLWVSCCDDDVLVFDSELDVAEGVNFALVVGGEHDGFAVLACGGDDVSHDFDSLGVQCVEGFVEDEDLLVFHDCLGQGEALAHS